MGATEGHCEGPPEDPDFKTWEGTCSLKRESPEKCHFSTLIRNLGSSGGPSEGPPEDPDFTTSEGTCSLKRESPEKCHFSTLIRNLGSSGGPRFHHLGRNLLPKEGKPRKVPIFYAHPQFGVLRLGSSGGPPNCGNYATIYIYTICILGFRGLGDLGF